MSERLSFEMVEVVKGDRFVDPLGAAVIKDLDHVPIEFDDTNSSFARPSNAHGRSFEDPDSLVLFPDPVCDENDDIYFIYSIKGASAYSPEGMYSSLEANHIRVNGMLDAATFPRVEAISRHLRKEGVLTEWPIYHARPKQFPLNTADVETMEQAVGLFSWKQMHAAVVWRYEGEHTGRLPVDSYYRKDQIGQYGAALQAVEDFRPAVMYRAMITNDRILDLPEIAEADRLAVSLYSAIHGLQLRNPDYFGIEGELQSIDPSRLEGWQKYMNTLLPKLMGANLARLHNAGAYHHYPHLGNWTLAGEIVDLDSVMCDQVFEDDASEVNPLNRINEARGVFNIIRKMPDLTGLGLDQKAMANIFRRAYFAERFGADNVTKAESVILDAYFVEQERDIRNILTPDIAKFSASDRIEMALGIEDITIAASIPLEIDDQPWHGKQLLDVWIERYLPTVTEQVRQFFIDENMPFLPSFVDPAHIAKLELYKLSAQLKRENSRIQRLEEILAEIDGAQS